MIKDIDVYINSLTFKNKEIKKFIIHYLGDFTHNHIKWNLDITKKIITLLSKYKLNELDVDNYFDFEKINREIHEIESFKTIQTNILTLDYKTNYKSKFVLGIYCSEKDQNKISKIYHYKS